VVYVEFLISFTCFFALFVCVVQLAIVATAKLVVQHAAVQAVRAAVVTIDDDPVFYDSGTRKHLESKGGDSAGDTSQRLAASALKTLGMELGHVPSGLGGGGTARLNRIRNAAYLPLSAISPTAEQVARWVPFATSIKPDLDAISVRHDIGDNPTMRIITGFGVYGRIGAAITFPKSPGSKELHPSSDVEFKDTDAVTVRVTYLLPCNVPLARDIVCRSIVGLTGIPEAVRSAVTALEDPGPESFKEAYQKWRAVPGALQNLTQDMKELMRAEWSYLQLAILTRLSERFVILSAEASLPNHGAPYKYYSELNEQGGVP